VEKLNTGLILFDTVYIICISFSSSSGITFLIRKYREHKRRRGEDQIVIELKKIFTNNVF
jgi:hypothetical protein